MPIMVKTRKDHSMSKVELTPFTGDDVRQFRADFNMSQQDLAELLGVTAGAVVWWESHQRKIPETTVRVLMLFRKEPKLMERF